MSGPVTELGDIYIDLSHVRAFLQLYLMCVCLKKKTYIYIYIVFCWFSSQSKASDNPFPNMLTS